MGGVRKVKTDKRNGSPRHEERRAGVWGGAEMRWASAEETPLTELLRALPETRGG